MKKVAIMQPYLFPYIGYFQLIQHVDQFVVYDNIQYTKKGWINRNRFLLNGKDTLFSIPLKNDSSTLNINQREIAPDFNHAKLLNQMTAAYKKAPYFESAFNVIEKIILNTEKNLFHYIHFSIDSLRDYLQIETPIVRSSHISIDHELKKTEKIIAICSQMQANIYINAIGGQTLYNKAEFMQQGLQLFFLKTAPLQYQQFNHPFIPSLSIIDVMMFNPQQTIKTYLIQEYELV